MISFETNSLGWACFPEILKPAPQFSRNLAEDRGRRLINADFERLVHRHTRRLDLFLGRVLGDVHSAEDVRQDTWSSLWTHRDRLGELDSWPYIRAVGLRKAIDRMRREKKAPISGIEFAEPAAPKLVSNGLGEGLARLGRDERAVLVLFFWEGLSVREISELLNVSTGTVKTWMFRGRQRLKKVWEKEVEE